MTKKHIILNAFNMNCVGHIDHGLWTHPRDRSTDYRKLSYLQTRGIYKTSCADGTLRQKLFGGDAHLDASHTGARFRHPIDSAAQCAQ